MSEEMEACPEHNAIVGQVDIEKDGWLMELRNDPVYKEIVMMV